MPSEVCTSQLTRPGRLDDSKIYLFADLQNLIATASEIRYDAVPDPAAPQIRLIQDTRTLYLKDDLSGPMPLNQMDSLGLVYQTLKLALTESLAGKDFITGNGNPNKPSTLPRWTRSCQGLATSGATALIPTTTAAT